ncbi:MAG: prephenate dehydrogenase [Actinobacteria bacterium]|nr:prephenate dehydrogenase [Actinomycetota bacterium]
MTANLLIVGTGLIGTSIGLALRGQADVVLADSDDAAVSAAVARGAGRLWNGNEPVAHALLAVPPREVAREFARLHPLGRARTYSHVASTQGAVQQAVETSVGDLRQFCGSHPMAGRELAGPQAAAADLFEGRPWALCPSPQTLPQTVAATRLIAKLCGAEPLVLTPEEHDESVALVSHLPQVTASALAATLLGRAQQDAAPVRLAGPGLQDTTRVAASDPDLWVDVLSSNAAAVAPLVRALAQELAAAADRLDELAAGPADSSSARSAQALSDLLRRGNEGRRLVPVKAGKHDRDFVLVQVGVPDRPGQLAGVLVSAADAGVNVEDVRVEHLVGRPRGVIELLVHATALARARAALSAAGWDVLG